MEETVLNRIPDDQLLQRLDALVSRSRRVEGDLVSCIGEVDDRKLYAREGFPSMFAYCVGSLHLSEAEAYLRITVARAARKHAVLLEMLRDGRLHLRAIAMLAPLLTEQNRDWLLRRATHLSKREVEGLLAELSPRPDVASSIRKLPEVSPAEARTDIDRGSLGELCPGRVDQAAGRAAPAISPDMASLAPDSRRGAAPAVTEVLSPGRFKVQFTASAELKDKLDRLTALMRSEIPNGDLARVIERAVSEKLERLEARRFAETSAPRKTPAESDTIPTSRRIPAAVRRAVHERDGGRCAYVDATGRRCAERGRLEFHHRHPYGMGGDHRTENLSLLCRAHNAYLAERDYGRSAIRSRRTDSAARPAPFLIGERLRPGPCRP